MYIRMHEEDMSIFNFFSQKRETFPYKVRQFFNTFNRKIKILYKARVPMLHTIAQQRIAECHIKSRPTSQQSTFTLATVVYIRRILSMIFLRNRCRARLLKKKNLNCFKVKEKKKHSQN